MFGNNVARMLGRVGWKNKKRVCTGDDRGGCDGEGRFLDELEQRSKYLSIVGGGLRRHQDYLKTEERKKEDARGYIGILGLELDIEGFNTMIRIAEITVAIMPYCNLLASVLIVIEATHFRNSQ